MRLQHNLLVFKQKPNARAFYEKFVSENSGFSKFQPDLIRQKMRNLRAMYTKTNDWRNSTGAGLTDENSEKSINGIRAVEF